jgi:predicted  nucleic acid-binding Zn-ribbon protein
LSDIENLLAVHELDVRIIGMRKELKDIPARKDSEKARIEAHKKALETSEEDLKGGQASAKERELEIDSFKEKIIKLRQQQFEIKTNIEFRAIEKEVAALEVKIVGVEDQELEIMETIENLKSGVAESKESLTKEEELLLSDLKAFDQRATELEQESDTLGGERTEAASQVAKEWLSAYDRVLERKDDALVPLRESVCGGCHLKLAPSVTHAVLRHTAPVICDFCGRLLYQA